MDDKSSYDKISWWIRNNKVTASLIFIGAVIIALSTFTDAARNLLDVFQQEKRPEINGVWSAELEYDWPGSNYTETFVFEGEGEELHGTATFLKRKHIIQEGTLTNNRLEFITKTKEISSSWDSGESKEAIHHYSGKITEDGIQFIMQTEGGVSLHTPIEFTAKKIPDPVE
ncbi:hypothetical protein [Maribellus sediminis]|uniref:hypothetical protein n=1 Tax=Maribellus sediminis TaxID=2696285 RepID=UPI001431AF21|nr:hypothetical protein [Maribellus sediminis]